MMPRKALAVALAAAVFIAGPALAPGFGGVDTGTLPLPLDSPPSRPAGYAVLISLLIHPWIGLHAAYGLIRRPRHPAWQPGRLPLALLLVLGGAWPRVAATAPVTALLLLAVMMVLGLLALVCTPAEPDRALLLGPVAVLNGWLCAGLCAAFGLVLAGHGLLDPEVAGLLSIAALIALGAAIQLQLDRAPEFGLTVIWALAALMVANLDQAPGLAMLAVAGIAGLSAATIRVIVAP